MSPDRPDHKIVDRTKIRDGAVANQPVHVALAVTVEGRREILGPWAGEGGEGAKHWQRTGPPAGSRRPAGRPDTGRAS